MDIPDVTTFFSVKLNQDVLEKHFGKLRQRGATNDNPTVAESVKTPKPSELLTAYGWMTSLETAEARKQSLILTHKHLSQRESTADFNFDIATALYW